MNIPGPYTFFLLALASFYLFYLISEAKIFDRPRAWLLGYSRWEKGEKLPDSFRSGLSDFIDCPWCLGFWIALAVWGAWQVWPHAVSTAAVALALAAALAFVALGHRLISQFLED